MKATLKPLSGKYYGTIVEVENNGSKYELKFWSTPKVHEPSDRELKYCHPTLTIEQWRNNEWIYDKEFDSSVRAKDLCELCDNHYENRTDYETAIEVVNALNGFRNN